MQRICVVLTDLCFSDGLSQNSDTSSLRNNVTRPTLAVSINGETEEKNTSMQNAVKDKASLCFEFVFAAAEDKCDQFISITLCNSVNNVTEQIGFAQLPLVRTDVGVRIPFVPSSGKPRCEVTVESVDISEPVVLFSFHKHFMMKSAVSGDTEVTNQFASEHNRTRRTNITFV